MKWDITQQWIDNSQELLMIALSYCGSLSYADGTPLQKVGVGLALDFDADRKKAYDLLSSMNPKLVVEELEAFMDCDTKHDAKVWEVWSSKLLKGTELLSLFDSVLGSGRKAPESWMKLGGWEQYIMQTKDKYEFVWLIAVVLQQKFDTLNDEVKFLTESYGLETPVSTKLSVSDNDTMAPESKVCKPVSKRAKSIYDIIQCEDKEGFVKRLHVLIDGKQGKDIAVVFIRAKIDGLITRYPTKGELNSEFDWHGSWQGIDKVLQRDWDNGVLDAANAIRFN